MRKIKKNVMPRPSVNRVLWLNKLHSQQMGKHGDVSLRGIVPTRWRRQLRMTSLSAHVGAIVSIQHR